MRNTILNALAALNKKKSDEEAKDGGFSLIELIVVVAILGILVAVAIPVYGNIQDTAAENAAKAACGSAVAEAAANAANGSTTAEADAEANHSKDGIRVTLAASGSSFTGEATGARGARVTCGQTTTTPTTTPTP